MLVNQVALRSIYTGFNTIFNRIFTEATPLYTQVATRVPSSTGEESYKWLGRIPGMREWAGDRQIQNLSACDYTIKNKDWELTIGVDRNDIEDDKLGVYSPVIQSLAQSTVEYPDDLVFGLMQAGFKTKCYDGKMFYSTHEVGKKTVSNKMTKALSPSSYEEARTIIMSMMDDSGKSLKLVPDLLVVPPALESMGRKILMADQIDGTTNTNKDTAKLLVVPALAAEPKAWHLLCTTKAIKPFIFQERKEPKFQAMDKDTDANVFMAKQFMYGVEARANAGYSFWQMAVGSTGEEV